MTLNRMRKLKKKYKKNHTKEQYPKAKCAFVSASGKPCKRNAVGKSTLCIRHGGTKYDSSLTLSGEDVHALVESGQTKFLPEIHPIRYIELSKEGLSPVEIAAQFQIGYDTLENWAERYSDFQIAHDIGKVLHEAWWLSKGKDGLEVRHFNTGLFKFLTGQTLGYSDKRENKNINTNLHGVLVVPKKVTEEEWENPIDK